MVYKTSKLSEIYVFNAKLQEYENTKIRKQIQGRCRLFDCVFKFTQLIKIKSRTRQKSSAENRKSRCELRCTSFTFAPRNLKLHSIYEWSATAALVNLALRLVEEAHHLFTTASSFFELWQQIDSLAAQQRSPEAWGSNLDTEFGNHSTLSSRSTPNMQNLW